MTYTQKVDTDFLRRQFANVNEMKKSNIKHIIDATTLGRTDEDVKDVVRLLCFLLCGCFLFVTGGDRVKWGFILYIKMREYTWNKAIVEELVNFIKKSNGDTSKLVGCTTLL